VCSTSEHSPTHLFHASPEELHGYADVMLLSVFKEYTRYTQTRTLWSSMAAIYISASWKLKRWTFFSTNFVSNWK